MQLRKVKLLKNGAIKYELITVFKNPNKIENTFISKKMNTFFASISLFGEENVNQQIKYEMIAVCRLLVQQPLFSSHNSGISIFIGRNHRFCYIFGRKILFLMVFTYFISFRFSDFYCFVNNILCDCTFFSLQNRNKDTLALVQSILVVDLKRQRGFGKKNLEIYFCLLTDHSMCSGKKRVMIYKNLFFSVWFCTIN